MRPVRLSDQAEADVEAIADFIAGDNPGRAESFVLELLQRCDALGTHPFQGRPASELGPDVRRLGYRGYVFLYRVLDEFIAIDRIFHGARDIEPLLDGKPGND